MPITPKAQKYPCPDQLYGMSFTHTARLLGKTSVTLPAKVIIFCLLSSWRNYYFAQSFKGRTLKNNIPYCYFFHPHPTFFFCIFNKNLLTGT